MANEIQGIRRRAGDKKHCVDISNPQAFFCVEESVSLTINFTDKELLDFYDELKDYLDHKRLS
jgi:hypothetical protein